jgi:hypothetical protein
MAHAHNSNAGEISEEKDHTRCAVREGEGRDEEHHVLCIRSNVKIDTLALRSQQASSPEFGFNPTTPPASMKYGESGNFSNRRMESNDSVWQTAKSHRSRVSYLRRKLKHNRTLLRRAEERKAVTDDKIIKILRGELLLHSTGSPTSQHLDRSKAIRLLESLQETRQEFGPLEDEQLMLEEELLTEEREYWNAVEELHTLMKENQPWNHSFNHRGNITGSEDSIDSIETSSTESSEDKQPLILTDFFSKKSTLEMLRRQYRLFAYKLDHIEDVQEMRAGVDLPLSYEDNEIQEDLSARVTQLLAEIRTLEYEVDALGDECAARGLLQPSSERQDSFTRSTKSLEIETTSNPLQFSPQSQVENMAERVVFPEMYNYDDITDAQEERVGTSVAEKDTEDSNTPGPSSKWDELIGIDESSDTPRTGLSSSPSNSIITQTVRASGVDETESDASISDSQIPDAQQTQIIRVSKAVELENVQQGLSRTRIDNSMSSIQMKTHGGNRFRFQRLLMSKKTEKKSNSARVKEWLLNKLRASAMEILILKNYSPVISAGTDSRKWEQAVLDCWDIDNADESRTSDQWEYITHNRKFSDTSSFMDMVWVGN